LHIFIAVFLFLVSLNSQPVFADIGQDMTSEFVKIKFLNSDSLVKGKSNSVYDIALDKAGRIYVAEYRKNKVMVLDKDLKYIYSIDNISTPHGITVDQKGFFYVATYKNNRIRKFDLNGKEVLGWDKKLIKEQRIHSPLSLVVDQKNNLFIADYGLKTIIKVDSNGGFLTTFNTANITTGEMLPHSIITDGKSYVYVADRSDNKAIHRFSLDGEYLETWLSPSQEFDPIALNFLDHKLILVSNYKNSALHLFDLKGQHLLVLGRQGDQPGEFLYATGIAVDERNHAYIAEEDGNRIQEIDLSEIASGFK